MIKFRCGKCGQKLGVPEEFAGRAVRCTNCREGVSVPVPEAASAQEQEPALETYETDDGFQDDSGLLNDDALAALGAPADGQEMIVPAPAVEAAGQTCPSCGSGVGAGAVICIQCGHNLKSGATTKIKVSKERGGGGHFKITGRMVAAMFVGGIVSSIGGVIWGVIAIFGMELGILAWGIGGLTGLAVAAIVRQRSDLAGIGAAVLALMGLMIGKGIYIGALAALVGVAGAMDSMGESDLIFDLTYQGQMVEQRDFEPELLARIDAVAEDEFWDDQLADDIQAAAEERIAGLTEDQRQAFIDEYLTFSNEVEDIDPWGDAFSAWDFLWFTFALGSAFSVGRGKA